MISHISDLQLLSKVRYGTKKGLTMASPPHRILGCPIDHLHPSSFVTANSTTPVPAPLACPFRVEALQAERQSKGQREKRKEPVMGCSRLPWQLLLLM